MTHDVRNPRWLPFLSIFQLEMSSFPNIFYSIYLIKLFFNKKGYLPYFELIQHHFC